MRNRHGLDCIFACQYGDQCSLHCFFLSSRDPRENGGSNGTRGDVTPGGSQSSSSHPPPGRPAMFLGRWTMSHNNSKIRPRNGGPDFDDMSALCHMQSTSPRARRAAIASSIEGASARVCSRVTHMGSSGGRGRCGGGCIGPPGPALCRRHPGIAQSMWHVNVAIHDPGRPGRMLLIDGLSRPGMVRINNSSLEDDGHGFLVSRSLARPVLERMHIGHRNTVHRTT